MKKGWKNAKIGVDKGTPVWYSNKALGRGRSFQENPLFAGRGMDESPECRSKKKNLLKAKKGLDKRGREC